MRNPAFLTGKRALVTGSTSGIGLAIARALQAEGAEVVLCGLGDPAEIAVLCDELSARHVPGDLSLRAGVEAVMAGAGPIDVLVNNAGMQHVSPIELFPVDKWDKILALNLTAAFDTSRLAVPHMKQAGWGRIINIACPFAHRIAVQSGLCCCQARTRWADQDPGAGACNSWRNRQLHQPGLCLDALGRKPDSRYHGGARIDPRTSHPRCHAGAPADRKICSDR